jgi:hypothetical protein
MNFSDATEEKKPVMKAKQLKEKVKQVVIYYCTKGQYSFDLHKHEKDAFDKIVKDENGKPKKLFIADTDGNNKREVMEDFKFERLPVKNPKTGKTDATMNIGRFIINPDHPRYQELIDRLEISRKNKYNGILTEDEYKIFVNPIAFQQETEKNALKDQNDDLQSENERLKTLLAEKGVKV